MKNILDDLMESFEGPKEKLDKAVLIANMRKVINQHSKAIQGILKELETLKLKVNGRKEQ